MSHVMSYASSISLNDCLPNNPIFGYNWRVALNHDGTKNVCCAESPLRIHQILQHQPRHASLMEAPSPTDSTRSTRMTICQARKMTIWPLYDSYDKHNSRESGVIFVDWLVHQQKSDRINTGIHVNYSHRDLFKNHQKPINCMYSPEVLELLVGLSTTNLTLCACSNSHAVHRSSSKPPFSVLTFFGRFEWGFGWCRNDSQNPRSIWVVPSWCKLGWGKVQIPWGYNHVDHKLTAV